MRISLFKPIVNCVSATSFSIGAQNDQGSHTLPTYRSDLEIHAPENNKTLPKRPQSTTELVNMIKLRFYALFPFFIRSLRIYTYPYYIRTLIYKLYTPRAFSFAALRLNLCFTFT